MTSQNAICINIQVVAPYVTMKKFAEITGVSHSTVKNLRAAGKLPILEKEGKKGRWVLDEFQNLERRRRKKGRTGKRQGKEGKK